MSATLSNAFIASFDTMVKQDFQKGSVLRGTVREKTGVVGSTHRFPRLGKGAAVARGTASADVVPIGYAHSNKTLTLSDWVAPEYSDIFDLEKINFDEKAELSKAIGMSLGRRMDEIIIGALNAATGTGSIAVGGTGLTLAKIISTSRILNEEGVEATDRYFAVSPQAIEDMLAETKITSSDYATLRALMTGEINTYMGFKWNMIETRAEGGLPLSVNDRTCFAYHKSAAGLGIGMEPKTEMNYVPHKLSWLITGKLSAGATDIDAKGIVKVVILES